MHKIVNAMTTTMIKKLPIINVQLNLAKFLTQATGVITKTKQTPYSYKLPKPIVDCKVLAKKAICEILNEN